MTNPSRQVANSGNIDITNTKGINFFLETGFNWLVHGFALLTVAVLFWMSWVIFQQAYPSIAKFGLGFLWSQEWDVAGDVFGALPYIYGTLVSSILALILAVPIGLAVALVTTEDFLPKWVRSPIALLVELIAAIPSVIIGLWGIYILIPWLNPLQGWLFQHLQIIPLFSTEPFGQSMLVAGIVLAIMILPTMAAISRDVLLVIPQELRTGSMALGSTRWEAIFKVLIPAGASGILSAAMLALGRALGETMAVTMVIGNSSVISISLLEAGYSIPAVLANEFPEADSILHIGSLTYLGLILFALTLAVNIGAVLIIQLIRGEQQS
ncbi:MAG: phosphate ABC transporter permease subunit PstC [Calothrix sp. MO_192.B10]|nr:phosphate ABC transporter permease subunit PstC [Calothrix sp. MO_192.B10]